MRLILSAVVLAAFESSVQAFKDTSPFLMFSSSPPPNSIDAVSKSQLQSSSAVLKSTKDFLKTCSSDNYYIISQSAVTSHEVSTSMRHVQKAMSSIHTQTRFGVNEVVGLKEGDAESLAKYIQTTCGATQRKAAAVNGKGDKTVVVTMLGALEGNSDQRAEALGDNDSDLYTYFLQSISGDHSYTIIFTTTPTTSVVDSQKAITYDPEFQEAFHMDLKRNVFASGRANEMKSSDRRPLFEKYNYFSPGLFMGLSVSLLLLAILSVGISAIAGLEVSYGAFDKEMGPAAQKKA